MTKSETKTRRNSSFGDILNAYRVKNKLSAEEFAKKISEQLIDADEITGRAVIKWENGESYPTIEKLVVISKILGKPIDELLKDKINCCSVNTYWNAENRVNKLSERSKSLLLRIIHEYILNFSRKGKEGKEATVACYCKSENGSLDVQNILTDSERRREYEILLKSEFEKECYTHACKSLFLKGSELCALRKEAENIIYDENSADEVKFKKINDICRNMGKEFLKYTSADIEEDRFDEMKEGDGESAGTIQEEVLTYYNFAVKFDENNKNVVGYSEMRSDMTIEEFYEFDEERKEKFDEDINKVKKLFSELVEQNIIDGLKTEKQISQLSSQLMDRDYVVFTFDLTFTRQQISHVYGYLIENEIDKKGVKRFSEYFE